MFDLILLALIGAIIFGLLFSMLFAYLEKYLESLISLAVMGLAMALFGGIAASYTAYAFITVWPENPVMWFDGIAMVIFGSIMAVIGTETAWQVAKDLLWLSD